MPPEERFVSPVTVVLSRKGRGAPKAFGDKMFSDEKLMPDA
jgi:hypothetical protein